MGEATPLNPPNSYFESIFDMCDKDGDGLVLMKDLQEYINSSRGRFLDLDEDIIAKVNSMTQETPQKAMNFTAFHTLMTEKSEKKKPKRRNILYWGNKYVNLIVPRKKKIKPKGRRMRRAATELDRFEDESYLDECTCCPPPITMLVISILEITCLVVDESIQKNSTLNGSGPTAAIFMYDPDKREQAWRYLTYMFVHIGYMHIVMNVAFQILIGLPLEMVHGWWRIIVIYLAGVLAGSLASSIVDPWVCLAGASGGVYALLTAHISSIIMNWSEMEFPSIQFFILIVFVTSDLGPAIYYRYYLDIKDSVSSIGHLGGAIAGLLVGIYILKNLKETKKEKFIWWYAVVLYFMLLATGVALNIFLPLGYFQGN